MGFVKSIALAVVLWGLVRSIHAQDSAAQSLSPKFEAASVKLSHYDGKLIGVRVRGGRLTADSVSVTGLIADAYQIQSYQVRGQPKWSDSDGIDVEAVAAGLPTREQFRLMLQALLTDRFHLQFHRETKELAIHGLVVAKGGPKFHEIKNAEDLLPGPWGVGQIRLRELPVLAAALSIYSSDLPVLDKTGLTGSYDLHMDMSAHSHPVEGDGPKPTAGERLWEAVQSQLGLKLVPMNATVEMFVIDHLERPSAN